MNRSNILAAVTLTALIGLIGFETVNAQPLDIRLAKIYIGENGGDFFGAGMGAAGDINGDGYADFMIGARLWIGGDTSLGRVYIYLGGDSIPDEPALTMNLNVREGGFGYELGGVGDLNGDGYDDYAISSGGIIDNQGAVRLYWGGDTLSTVPFAVLRGSQDRELFGATITGGDFNSDGYRDLVIAAPSSGSRGTLGRVFVYFGSDSFDTIPDWSTGTNVDEMRYGNTLSTGDLNGDGIGDLIIGEQDGSADSTVVHIFYGGADFDTLVDVRIINRDDRWYDTGDITGDGIDDLVLWDRVTETHAVFYGGAGFDNLPDDHFDFDAHTVSVGHFDRDGIKDVVMGNSFSNRVRIYRGGFPIDKTPDWETREGDFLSAYGHPVLSLGDINGDGANDFLVSEIFGGPSDNSEGQVYLYLGDSAFVISAEPDKPILPTSYLTLQAYPNPFNASTTIKYSIPSKSLVRLDIYNIRGELIETLTDRVHEAGEYRVTFDGNRLSSGIYFMSLNSLREREVTKILLLK